MLDIIKEILKFLISRRKYWLLPIFLVLLLFGILFFVAQGSVISPFIYTIF